MNAKNKVYTILLFLISPVLAAIPAIRNFAPFFSRLVFIGLIGFTGYNLIIRPGNDAYSHYLRLQDYLVMSGEQFFVHLIGILQFSPQSRAHDDLYMHLMSFFVTRFSIDAGVLFLFVGLVFGAFYIGSVHKVYNIIKARVNLPILVLLIFFIFWKSIDGMPQIRFWTGAWVVFFGLFGYIEKNDKRYLLFVLAGPMVHFAHFISLIVIVAALMVKNYPKGVFIFFLASFIFLIIPANFLAPFLSLTDIGEARSLGYVREDASGFFTFRGSAFHAFYYLPAGKVFYTIILLLSAYLFNYYGKNRNRDNSSVQFPGKYNVLATAGFLFLSVANIMNFSKAINMRFSIFAGFFAISYAIILYSHYLKYYPDAKNTRLFQNTTLALSPLVLLVVYTQGSIIGDFIDFRVLVSPLLTGALGDDPISIKEFLRSIVGY